MCNIDSKIRQFIAKCSTRLTWRARRWKRNEIVQVDKISIVSKESLCRLFLTLTGRQLAGCKCWLDRVWFDRCRWRLIVNADKLLHATKVPRVLPCRSVSCRLCKTSPLTLQSTVDYLSTQHLHYSWLHQLLYHNTFLTTNAPPSVPIQLLLLTLSTLQISVLILSLP